MMEKNNRDVYSNVLREKRIQFAMTQAEVAEAIGVSVITVGRWERGQTMPTPYCTTKLCRLFETTPAELGLERKTKPSSSTAQIEIDKATIAQPPEVARSPAEEESAQDAPEEHAALPVQTTASLDMQRASRLLLAPLLKRDSRYNRLVSPGFLFMCILVIAALLYLSRTGGAMLPFAQPAASPTHHPTFIQTSNPVKTLQSALASPLLYHDPLTDGSTIASQEKHWSAIDGSCFFSPLGYQVRGHRPFCHERGASYQNMTISVDMTIADKSSSGALLFRDQDLYGGDGAYVFEVSTDGRYHITGLYGTIHDWTFSSALHQGAAATNTLQVIASGNLFLFYLNSTFVTSLRDNSYERGGISFACFTSNSTCTATFRNLNVYVVES